MRDIRVLVVVGFEAVQAEPGALDHEALFEDAGADLILVVARMPILLPTSKPFTPKISRNVSICNLSFLSLVFLNS